MKNIFMICILLLTSCVKIEYVKPIPVYYTQSQPPPPPVLEPINIDTNLQNSRSGGY
jgi:hypothetical protein